MSELASQLREYNDWRRGALISQPDPVELGQAIDAAIVAIQQRDYLDALAKEYFEKLNGWQSACIAAEKQRDELLAAMATANEKLRAATMCHPNAVETLVEEAFQITGDSIAGVKDIAA